MPNHTVMISIFSRLQEVHRRIEQAACAVYRRPEEISLLAVSKTWPAEYICAAAEAGQRAFGENYVQEGVDKSLSLKRLGLEWHFIGPLQSNKTRHVAECFDWVHSVDRLRIAERLSAQRPPGLPPLNICLQINVSGEVTKSGASPSIALELAEAVDQLPGLRLRGLMCIPEPTDDVGLQRTRFAMLADIQRTLIAEGFLLDTLSMGMSHDLEAAIAEGATIVRVGTAIFGSRVSG